MLNYSKSKELMEKANSIAIFTHRDADGDAIGSAFALYLHLVNLGKQVDVFSDSMNLPNQLDFLKVKKILNKKTCSKYDLAIATDSNTLEMLGRRKEQFSKFPLTIQFDHHPQNPEYATVNNTTTEVSSACELVADFLFDMFVLLHERYLPY